MDLMLRRRSLKDLRPVSRPQVVFRHASVASHHLGRLRAEELRNDWGRKRAQSECLTKGLLKWRGLLRLLDVLRHRLDRLLKLPELRGNYLKELLDLLELLLLLVL